jgi:hypothetical protein
MEPRINIDAPIPELPAQPYLRRSDFLHEITVREIDIICRFVADVARECEISTQTMPYPHRSRHKQ